MLFAYHVFVKVWQKDTFKAITTSLNKLVIDTFIEKASNP